MDRLALKKYFMSKEFKENYVYDGNDLGLTYKKDGSIFKVWAPTASDVSVNIYTTGSEAEGGEKLGTYPMTKGDKGVFVFDAKELGDLANRFYTYNVTVNGNTEETIDIYAKACGVNGNRGMIVDLDETNPEGFDADHRIKVDKADVVIYEVHVKDFSSQENSGVTEKNRGKFLAFTEQNTWLNGDESTGFPTCVNYLKQLGVTHVHLLPVYDFGSIDEASDLKDYNWGYDPMNYNIPEGSYSTNPYDGRVRINEFKQMVMGLHKAGIGVIMDVVYNHTYVLDTAFQKTVPYYYYRISEDGTMSDASCCGNETASEHDMYRKFMIDSVLYWAKEYHIDGFRFDLMGIHDTETLNIIREKLNTEIPDGKTILMYGEPWTAGPTALEEGYISAVTANAEHLTDGINIFSDDIRDTVKGSVFVKNDAAYVNLSDDESVTMVEKLKKALVLKNRVSYVSAHDNYTLYDKLILSTGDNAKVKSDYSYEKYCEDKIVYMTAVGDEKMYARHEEIVDMNKLAAGIVLTSGGMSFFQAGEEFLRTKQGIGDSYISPIEINQLDWVRACNNKDVVDYYKELIALRKKYKILANVNGKNKYEFVSLEGMKENCIAYKINNKLMVVFNPNTTDIKVNISGKVKRVFPSNAETFKIDKKSIAVYEI